MNYEVKCRIDFTLRKMNWYSLFYLIIFRNVKSYWSARACDNKNETWNFLYSQVFCTIFFELTKLYQISPSLILSAKFLFISRKLLISQIATNPTRLIQREPQAKRRWTGTVWDKHIRHRQGRQRGRPTAQMRQSGLDVHRRTRIDELVIFE